jgi:DNA-binding transcriptional LysR family regulator
MGVLTDSALKARKLAQAERLVVASPAYLARRGVPRVPSNLLENTTVLFMARVPADRNVSVGVALRRRRSTSGRA